MSNKRAVKRRDLATLAVALNLNVVEVEALTGFSRKRIYELIAQEKLKTYRLGRRRYATRRALDECIVALEAA